ncbi:MAG: hypothetical protein GF364_21725, partial [Candidatus Lokiarchaeota archaeon]|nr:hypothetical protein [Candidatus Lokiarchaeota archaeon]
MNMKKSQIITYLSLILFASILSLSLGQGISTSLESDATIPNASYYLSEPSVYERTATDGVIDSDGRKLFYWIQISDIHINMDYPERLTNFEDFCEDINNIIEPAFVLSTGDNVDGGSEDPEKHQHYQIEEEHVYFNNTLTSAGFSTDFWYSGVGNHERYNTAFDRSMYHQYIRNESQYAFDFTTSWGKYRFVMADTTQEYGLSNNLCLFGEMKTNKLDHLESLIQAGDASNLNDIIVTGHQAINQLWSQRTSTGNTFSGLIRKSESSVYLTGHNHFENLYNNRKEFLEIHCPSFRDRYMYRICAMDDDVFSFTDVKHREWPHCVITSPVDGRFYVENMELDNMLSHDEIRILIFDSELPGDISTEVFIDEVSMGSLTYQESNLWTLDWTPADYNDGNAHTLNVQIQSASGTENQTIQFNLSDFTPMEIGGYMRYLIVVPIKEILIGLLVLLFVAAMANLIVPKIYYLKHRERLNKLTPEDFDKPTDSFITKHIVKKWFQTAIMPSSLYIPLFVTTLYAILGPAFIAPICNDNIG